MLHNSLNASDNLMVSLPIGNIFLPDSLLPVEWKADSVYNRRCREYFSSHMDKKAIDITSEQEMRHI